MSEKVDYIDQLVTVWKRVYLRNPVPKEEVHDILTHDRIDGLYDRELVATEEYIVETEVELTPEQNNGNSTLEYFNEEKLIIYNNAKHDNKD